MKTKLSLTPKAAAKARVEGPGELRGFVTESVAVDGDTLAIKIGVLPSTVSTMPAPPVPREIRIVRQDDTGEVVRRFDVTGQSDRAILKIISGVLRNMDVDSFRVEDSADDVALKREVVLCPVS
jgi:hypothetical protein